jgi:hypothetical protein
MYKDKCMKLDVVDVCGAMVVMVAKDAKFAAAED